MCCWIISFFFWFLLFSMCHSLHVAFNKCINWCFVRLYLLFYYNNKVLCWWSIINHLLSTAMKTLNLKYFGATILIFRNHVTSSERDHRTRREHFPIGGQWWQWIYLAQIRRYGASKMLGSRDTIGHVTIGLGICGFLLLVYWNHATILHRYRDIGPQRFWGPLYLRIRAR